MKELGKITKYKDLWLKIITKINHNLVAPVTMYECESWTGKKADVKEAWFIRNLVLEESFTDTLDCQKDEQVVS